MGGGSSSNSVDSTSTTDEGTETAEGSETEAGETEASEAASAGGKETINLWSFSEEIPNMALRYLELNPEFADKYHIEVTVIGMGGGGYQQALDQALLGGGADAPDIYVLEAAFALKYTQGELAEYAMTYDDLLGIDTKAAVAEAQIAPYITDIGTRGNDIVALGPQATGGAAIYRRSIAEEVWGTDDPDEVAAKIGPGWDKFMAAAAEMKEHGYAMVSGTGDVWSPVLASGETPWVVDGKLSIAPGRERFLDFAKELYENEYMNDAGSWSDAWFADMGGNGAKEVFTFLGASWLINYVMADNVGETAGDWAVAVPPEGFFAGGTWLVANNEVEDVVKDGVAEILEWVSLDTSEEGLQYLWANGTLYDDDDTKVTVASSVVMASSNGEVDILGGQDMFDVYIPACEAADASNISQYDEFISGYFDSAAIEYATGLKTREEALESFKQQIADNLGITVD